MNVDIQIVVVHKKAIIKLFPFVALHKKCYLYRLHKF